MEASHASFADSTISARPCLSAKVFYDAFIQERSMSAEQCVQAEIYRPTCLYMARRQITRRCRRRRGLSLWSVG